MEEFTKEDLDQFLNDGYHYDEDHDDTKDMIDAFCFIYNGCNFDEFEYEDTKLDEIRKEIACEGYEKCKRDMISVMCSIVYSNEELYLDEEGE